jgi:hypothetical protein
MQDDRAKYIPLLRNVFLVSGLIILADLALFGAGIVLPGGLSLRRLLFVLMMGIALFQRLLLPTPFTRQEIALMALLSVLVCLWSIVLPQSYGFEIGNGVSDVNPWLTLAALAVWPWGAWRRPGQWQSFRKYFVALCVLLALVHIAVWTLFETEVVSPDLFYAATKLIATSGADPDSAFINVGRAGDSGYRVYWSSSIFLLGGVYFLVAYRPAPITKSWLLAVGLVCFALWTTYIRAFLASAAIFAGLWFLLARAHSGRARLLPELQVVALWVICILSVCLAIDPAILQALHLSRDVSDTERVDQASALLAQFSAHPWLGTGFGSYVAQNVRSEAAPWSYELVFHSLLMKLGLVGMVLLVVILCMALLVADIRATARANPRIFAIWAAFTTGFWFAGATNPMVTNFAGMAIVVILLVDVRQWADRRP